jgi:hypothetical protein
VLRNHAALSTQLTTAAKLKISSEVLLAGRSVVFMAGGAERGLGKHAGEQEVAGGDQATHHGDEGEAFESVVGFGGAGVHGVEVVGVAIVSQDYDSYG